MDHYGSILGVQALVPQAAFDAQSNPTTQQVTAWLEEGAGIINRYLGSAGYVAPVVDGPTVVVMPELAGLNDLYAAAYVLRSQKIDSASGDQERTSEVWLEDFWTRLRELVASNLSLVGVTLLPVGAAGAPPGYPRRIRTLQARRIDGYARGATNTWQIVQGEYTEPGTPAE
jgi:hypothetical protein